MKYACATLKNKEWEAQMQQDGLIYIPQFFPSEVIKKMLELYQRHHTEINKDKGMWNSLFDITPQESEAVSQEIRTTLLPFLNNLFENYEVPVASFMSKNPGEHGVCDFHRDFSILDETRFEYRNVWIPLIDIDESNGGLYVLKKSHVLFDYPLPLFEKWAYTHLQDALYCGADNLSVKAGDLVIYADRTLHGSHLNLSNTSRPVIHLGALPKNYEMAYYFKSGNKVKVFQVPASFYLQNKFGDVSDQYPLIHEFEYAPPKINFKP